MPIKLVDAHMHLADPDFSKDIQHIIAFVKNVEIVLFVNSMDLDSSKKTLSLSELLDDKLLPFVGIHPWSVQEADLEEFENFLNREKDSICGIGEVGLDRKYAVEEMVYLNQKSIFEKILELAERFEKPVSIHSRNSQKDVIDILSSFRIKSIMLHWFSGDYQQLSKAVDMGCYVSFGPTVIFSKRSRALAERTPRELILTETDGPVRYACFGGKPALPSFLPSVVFALSSILKLNPEETANLVRENSSSYMDIYL